MSSVSHPTRKNDYLEIDNANHKNLVTYDGKFVKMKIKQQLRICKGLAMCVLILLPKITASPDVGGRRPTSIEIVVLFPAPLWPTKEKENLRNSIREL